ncbi:MAG TPA: hypothetical protein VFS64_08005 [Solirubrobacterales bacterium]|nr:hypothetical protein [Solirubrobacterales bacterium]
MAREEWTDARLYDFKENVNQRFDDVDKRFDQVEARMAIGFAEVKGEVKDLRQTMVHGFFALVGMQATSTLTLIGVMIGLKVF